MKNEKRLANRSPSRRYSTSSAKGDNKAADKHSSESSKDSKSGKLDFIHFTTYDEQTSLSIFVWLKS